DMYSGRQDYSQDGRSHRRAAKPTVRAYEDDGYAADDYYDLPDVEPREPLERTYEEEASGFDRNAQSGSDRNRSARCFDITPKVPCFA
ncbi:MAG: hypothetical protein MUD08_12980, partial [Cytophagales bacterium]|nr:hypothetical protein [Cytophagales bacterium]